MKLYTYDTAPNPARLKMFLEYKDIHLETQQIDLAQAEQLNEQYLSSVPEATVPVLVLEDGTRLTEVVAIVSYLESVYPERPLLGVTPQEKALVINWSHRIFSMLYMAAAEAFRNSHPAYKDRALPGPRNWAQIPALAERGRDRLIYGLDVMNQELASRDWVAGSGFSFADIDLLALLVFASWGAKVKPDDSHGHLLAWQARAQAALKA